MKRIFVTALSALLPVLAASHTGSLEHGHDFISGFIHPMTGPDHLAAMLAVGLWSGLALSRPWHVPMAFALMLLAGALVGMSGLAGVGLSMVEPMIAVSVLALGLLAALRQQMSLGAALVLVGTFAFFHGVAHGTELDGSIALLGMVLATWLLHLAGLGLGLLLRRQARLQVALSRVLGGGIALLGLGLLARMV
ncbi:HupE/UreJ family protein [Paucibacter sp. B2R-40]|uniref:HupE/UreJ family protein n=1 Tax=Paucibacter sp. B2R-40 TaxID=2893554 RepID=UPI0021E4CA0C|nr:HupE/UreJ family protein [Paucibacter sp. B2R-40]MCV2353282.1 HupE/UreJ family protein [Paucibacter sp. B2R-40]